MYFDYIGIDPDVLEMLLEADTEEYLQVLQQPLAIDRFVVRYGAAMYATQKIPLSTETEAIQHVREYQKKMALRCWIDIQHVKYIFFSPDSSVSISNYYPEFRINKRNFGFY